VAAAPDLPTNNSLSTLHSQHRTVTAAAASTRERMFQSRNGVLHVAVCHNASTARAAIAQVLVVAVRIGGGRGCVYEAAVLGA
jgi:hypothetical protein